MSIGFAGPYITVTDRLSREIATVTLPTTAGSMSVPEFADGEPWWFEYIQGVSIGTMPREISVSGTTLSWTSYTSSTEVALGIY